MSENETGGDHGPEKDSQTVLSGKVSDIRLLAQKVNDVGQPVVQDINHLVSSEKLTEESSSVENPSQVTKKDAIPQSNIRKLPVLYDAIPQENETIILPSWTEPPPPKEIHDTGMSLKPIPPEVEPGPSKTASLLDFVKKEDEIPDIKPSDVDNEQTSDTEEAGYHLDSDSRSSRIFREASRRLRQLVCCGYKYSAPSEDNVSYNREFSSGI